MQRHGHLEDTTHTYSLLATGLTSKDSERIRRAFLSAARRLKIHGIGSYYSKEATNHVCPNNPPKRSRKN